MNLSVEIFHNYCYNKWSCYNCPVCCYIRNPKLMKNSSCMKCDRTNALWFCITCGHVGCSRKEHGHALAHYRDTQHEYVMELGKLDVWSYRENRFEHKLNDKEKTLETIITRIKNSGENRCSCPVCQYIETPKLLKKSTCMKCETDLPYTLWICLCCSHIGCSRHTKGHALEHYETTNHSYCMKLDDFSVWDYSAHRYLHRFLHDNIGKGVTKEDAQEHYENRMVRLENEWKEFKRLSEANEKMLRIEQRLLTLAYEKTALEVKLREHDAKLDELIIQFYSKREVVQSVKYISSTYGLNSNQTENWKVSQIQNQSQCCSTKYMNVGRNHDEAKPFKVFEFRSLIVVTLVLYQFVTLVLQIISEDMRKIM